MGSINRVILTGRLTADPELRYTSKETPVANFALAVGRFKKNGEDSADFIRCIAWGRLAKVANDYLKKGRLVAIEGRLHSRRYQVNGQNRSAVEVILDGLQMLDRKFFEATESKTETDAPPTLADIEIIDPAMAPEMAEAVAA